MKTKNLYYATVFKRTNTIKMMILSFFLAIASWPRLFLEVFLRKNFGERYFSFSTAIIITWIFALLPYAWEYSHSFGFVDKGKLVLTYATWYLYLAAFVYFSWLRWMEVKREPGVFDFARFSLSTGNINPSFYKMAESMGLKPTSRNISTLLEPLVCFVIGALLFLIGQSVGTLIIVCSICYSLSYAGAYHLGDQFVMDTIDEMICNEELVDSFVNNEQPSETRGFEAYGKRPTNADFRRKVVDNFRQEDDFAEAL